MSNSIEELHSIKHNLEKNSMYECLMEGGVGWGGGGGGLRFICFLILLKKYFSRLENFNFAKFFLAGMTSQMSSDQIQKNPSMRWKINELD